MGWRNWFPPRAGNVAHANDESALQAVGNGRILLAQDRATLEARRYACACSVVVKNEGTGTGFLVAKNLVMTNYHVVMDDKGKLYESALIHCRFGFHEAGEYGDGRSKWVGLNGDDAMAFPAWSGTAPGDRDLTRLKDTDFVDALNAQSLDDYVILRLAEPVGDAPGKGALGDMNPLGWISVDPTRALPQVGQPLFVVEFPQRIGAGPRSFRQQPSSVAEGSLKDFVAGGLRVEHDAATKPGASGGPVFDSRLGLIGLHNAGRERPDGTAENRFIPISRIMADIKRKNLELYQEIVGATPPPLTTSGISRKMGLAITERVRAAKTLLDREREHASIVAALGRNSESAVRVNHVVYEHNPDEIDYFIQRLLNISAARSENLQVAQVMIDFLRGQLGGPGSFVPWADSSISWPWPETPLAQAKNDMLNQLNARVVGSRTLLVIEVPDVDERTPAEELEYIKLLGELLWSYRDDTKASGLLRPLLLAVVIHRRPVGSTFDLTPFLPLWAPDAAPPHCGVSVALDKVRLNDVQPWVTMLNSTWSLRDEQRIAVPDSFDRRAKLSMSQVFELLETTISDAATEFVKQSLEGT